MRTSGIYLRAEAEDVRVLEGSDDRLRSELISERLRNWQIMRTG